MKSSMLLFLRRTLGCAPLLATLVIASNAAAITIDHPSRVKPAEVPGRPVIPAATLPKRSDLLTVDWVDAKAGRIGIGGITYVVRAMPTKIVLDNGDEVASIGYLKAGMHVHIDTAVDGAGVERLITIRVAT